MDSKTINQRLELLIDDDCDDKGDTSDEPLTGREIRMSLRETPSFILNITRKCIERLEYLTVLEINQQNKSSSDSQYDSRNESEEELEIGDIIIMINQTISILHKLLKNIFETRKWLQYFLENISEVSGKPLIDALITVLSIKLIDLATNRCYPGMQQLRTIETEIRQYPPKNKDDNVVVSVVTLYRQLICRNACYSVDHLMYQYVSSLEKILRVIVCEEVRENEPTSKTSKQWTSDYFCSKNKYHHFVYLILEAVVLGFKNKERSRYWNYPFYHLHYGNEPKKLIQSSLNYLSYSIVYCNKLKIQSNPHDSSDGCTSVVDILCKYQNMYGIVECVVELLKKASTISRFHVYPDGKLLQWSITTFVGLLVDQSQILQIKIVNSSQLEQFIYYLLCIIEYQTHISHSNQDFIPIRIKPISIMDLCVQILAKLSINRIFAIRINNQVQVKSLNYRQIFTQKVGFVFEGIVEILTKSYPYIPTQFQEKSIIVIYNISPYILKLTELYVYSLFQLFKMTQISKKNSKSLTLLLKIIINHINYSTFGREFLFYYMLLNYKHFCCPLILEILSICDTTKGYHSKVVDTTILISKSMENKYSTNELVSHKTPILNFLRNTILVGSFLDDKPKIDVMDIDIDQTYWDWLMLIKNKPKSK